MHPAIDHTLTGLTAIVAGVVGSQALPDLLSQVPAPDWIQQLQGPFGALIGLAMGLWWMKTRLDKAEAKADKRDEERDQDRKTLITVVEQNSHLLRDVKEHLGQPHRE
jgi:putative Mn2+ efflux pump MntP